MSSDQTYPFPPVQPISQFNQVYKVWARPILHSNRLTIVSNSIVKDPGKIAILWPKDMTNSVKKSVFRRSRIACRSRKNIKQSSVSIDVT